MNKRTLAEAGPERKRLRCETLLIGLSLLTMTTPAALAQQADDPAVDAVSGPTRPGQYLVFFELDRSTLTPNGRRVVGEAAQEFQRTGAARVALAGHADRSASVAHNERLSERRVEAVRNELVRLGVPGGAISTVAQGETDPLVQTADGVREARNRRVEIDPAAATGGPSGPAGGGRAGTRGVASTSARGGG